MRQPGIEPGLLPRFAAAPRLAAVLAAGGFAALLCLSACSNDLSRTFGLTRDAPDEFQVTTRAPLSMPPDYVLRPPQPGATRPQELSTPRAAEAALVPQAALTPGGSGAGASGQVSPGEQALLSAAGPPAQANIRNTVDADAAAEANSKSLTDYLMFWRTKPPPGVTVDPTKEAERLRQNAALGQNVNAGDTPIIVDRPKGWWDRFFSVF
jgi:hypothetical protein